MVLKHFCCSHFSAPPARLLYVDTFRLPRPRSGVRGRRGATCPAPRRRPRCAGTRRPRRPRRRKRRRCEPALSAVCLSGAEKEPQLRVRSRFGEKRFTVIESASDTGNWQTSGTGAAAGRGHRADRGGDPGHGGPRRRLRTLAAGERHGAPPAHTLSASGLNTLWGQ